MHIYMNSIGERKLSLTNSIVQEFLILGSGKVLGQCESAHDPAVAVDHGVWHRCLIILQE